MWWDHGFYLTIIHNFFRCMDVISIVGIGGGAVWWHHRFYLTIIHNFFCCKDVISIVGIGGGVVWWNHGFFGKDGGLSILIS